MQILFFGVVIWGVITLLGHGTWVLIRTIFRALGPEPPSETQPTLPEPRNDLLAFKRMLDGLTATERLSVDEAENLKTRAIDLVDQITSTRSPATFDDPFSERSPEKLAGTLTPPLAASSTSANPLHAPPVVATSSVDSQPSAFAQDPKRALSTVLAGFLEQHNIRWGELIAGMLIVLCSIGLVLSLWNTLTSAHRIVPAIVFMSADAAIFAAGLYTMRRWKLRHTSRAVLIIATLLVPLCVLAGLAAAGADATSVSLTDPVTMTVIILATVGCGWLLWKAAVELVGRAGASALSACVVASSLTLPLLPTASRWLGIYAGWMVLVPSLITAIALVAQQHLRDFMSPRAIRQTRIAMGPRAWKNHWLHIGIAVASLASVIVYAAFLFRDAGRAVWIQIAIATIPTWVAIAMIEFAHTVELKKANENDQLPGLSAKGFATKRLIASVIASLAVGLILVILPASIERLSWLWTHAVGVGLSVVMVSLLRKRPEQILLGMLPIGLVAMVTSPVWISGQPWSDVTLQQLVFSAEPVFVAALMFLSGIGLQRFAGLGKHSGTTSKNSFNRVPNGPRGRHRKTRGPLGTRLNDQRPQQDEILLEQFLNDVSTRWWTNIWSLLTLVTLGTSTLRQVAGVIAAPLADGANSSMGLLNVSMPSNTTLILQVAGLIVLALGRYLAPRDPVSVAQNHQRIGVNLIGVLFVAVMMATRYCVGVNEQLIVMVTLAACGLGILGWHLRLKPLATTAVGLVGVASVVLLESSWVPSIFDQVTRDPVVAGALAAWWVACGIVLARSRDVRQRIPSSVLFALTAVIITPAIQWTSPIVWLQASALGSIAWIAMNGVRSRWSQHASSAETLAEEVSDEALDLSIAWIQFIGAISATMVLVGIVIQAPWTLWWSLPLGGLMTLAALATFAIAGGRQAADSTNGNANDRTNWRWSLPFTLPIMSGHLACYSVKLGWVHQSQIWTVVVACGLIGCLGSAVYLWRIRSMIHAWHVVAQTVLLLISAVAFSGGTGVLEFLPGNLNASTMYTIAALVGLAIGAVALMRFPSRILSRSFGWIVVLAGAYLSGIQLSDYRLDSSWLTRMMVWTAGCVVVWRSDRLARQPTEPSNLQDEPDGDETADTIAKSNHGQWSRADVEASALMLPMLASAGAVTLFSPQWQIASTFQSSVTQSILQCVIAMLVGASAWMCRDRDGASDNISEAYSRWHYSLWLIIGALSIGGALFATIWGATTETRWLVFSLSGSCFLAAAVCCLPRRGHLAIESAIDKVTVGCVLLGTLIALGISSRVDPAVSVETAGTMTAWTRLTILGIGVLAWAMFSLSEQTRPSNGVVAIRRRYRCIGIGLWATSLLAVIGSGDLFQGDVMPDALSVLIASMRLLIACVLAVGLLLLVIPKLLNGPFVDRWQSALRRGGQSAGATAFASLSLMLGLEWVLRRRDLGIEGLPLPIVAVVTVMLGAFAMMSGVIAILSGPSLQNASKPNWLRIQDHHRTGLLYVAQGLGGLTWLHFYLCRGSSAYLGLRQIWPYVVMALAFASVGLAQWAHRRKDSVLFDNMKRTAMFLPLIPVIGFWISGAYATMLQDLEWSWTFYRGTTSYHALLIVGAIYYGVMSFVWKNGFPRFASVILANAGLWVMLTQTPGWSFLMHPQAWLIPPAACVLLIAHMQRDALEPAIGSAIRYAATLMIYLSSTADMLFSEIGNSLWGPIILIGLSMVGMLAGVALRIKPFLYLGAIFMFLGIMSMVWRAGQAIDAVWPWWVFGITMGLILLSVLAGIEKHKAKLTQWTNQLSAWD